MTANTRALLIVAVAAGIPAIVLGLVALFAGGPIAGVVVLVVVAAAVGAWVRLGADRRMMAGIGGRDADPTTDARLWNLVEGLTIGAGVRSPRLRVVPSAGLNAMAAGTSSSRAVLGVTTGLLTELDRIELEAVLAEELIQIRRGDTIPITLLAATFGLGGGIAVAADRDTVADMGAVGLTRYPPALAAALEKIDAKGAAVTGQGAGLSQLWLADPAPAGAAGRASRTSRGRIPLRERIEALQEL